MNILIVKNKGYVPFDNDAFDTITKATGVTLNIDQIDIDIPLSYKSFDDTSQVKGLWGLDGIKQQLRDSGRIPENYYHIVYFAYNSERTDVAYWTYPNPLQDDSTVFVEIPTRPEWWVKKGFCHEFLHACHRLCLFKGILTSDTMDKYDGDMEPMSGANYQRNIEELKPHFRDINTPMSNWDKPNFIASFILSLMSKVLSIQLSQPIMQNQLPVGLLWDTPEHARHSARVIMDEYNLSWADKDLLCACIMQESGFHPNAIGKPNSNGTIDYGLCQFNNGKNSKGQALWIGKGADFKDVNEVLTNPEKNVRIMCREFLAGHLSWWSSYSTKAYLKWMPK